MSCHESLMARRRKKSKAAAQARAREKENSPMVEKSLPALPPNAIPPNAFSNDRVDPESDTPTELSPRPRPPYIRGDSSRSNSRPPPRSPERPSDTSAKEGLSLPSTTYRKNRNSAIYAGTEISSGNNNNNSNITDDSSFFIPVALDPSPVPSATPRSTNENLAENRRTKDKDYFSLSKSTIASAGKADSQSSTPHIAFQEKARQPSASEYEGSPAKDLGRKLSKSSRTDKSNSSNASPIVGDDRSQKMAGGKPRASDDFKLQEAPKSKRMANSRSNSQPVNTPPDSVGSRSNSRKDKDEPTQHLQAGDLAGTPRSSQDSRLKEDDDMTSNNSFGTSSANHVKSIPRKELPSTVSRTGSYKPSMYQVSFVLLSIDAHL